MARLIFEGSDIFIGNFIMVYPGPIGYWVDVTTFNGKQTDTFIHVMDDYGNLVNVLRAARQRQIYRDSAH